MLIGEYSHTIDAKRRLAIPSKFRKELGKKAVITRGLDNCLFILGEKEWSDFSEKLRGLPTGQSDARLYTRLFFAGAMDVEFDGLGRILVPDYLKDYAGLKKKVMVTGVLNRIEIWDEEIWNKYKKRAEDEIGNIAERLGELGV